MDANTLYVFTEVFVDYVSKLCCDNNIYRICRSLSTDFMRRIDKDFPILHARRRFLRRFESDRLTGYVLPNWQLNGVCIRNDGHSVSEEFYLEGKKVTALVRRDANIIPGHNGIIQYINRNKIWDNRLRALTIKNTDFWYEYFSPDPNAIEGPEPISLYKNLDNEVYIRETPVNDVYELEIGRDNVTFCVQYKLSQFYSIIVNVQLCNELIAVKHVNTKEGIIEFQKNISIQNNWKYNVNDIDFMGGDFVEDNNL